LVVFLERSVGPSQSLYLHNTTQHNIIHSDVIHSTQHNTTQHNSEDHDLGAVLSGFCVAVLKWKRGHSCQVMLFRISSWHYYFMLILSI